MPVGLPVSHASATPLVRLSSRVFDESQALRGFVSRVRPHLTVMVRVRILAIDGSGIGCTASAVMKVRADARGRASFVLAPRGVWCAGAGTVRVTVAGHAARAPDATLHVRAPDALGVGNLVGHLLLGPTCPVERANEPCDPVARPAPVALVALDRAGVERARTTTRSDGSFALDLPAGDYTLHADASASGYPRIVDKPVSVPASATVASPLRITIDGDTGIR